METNEAKHNQRIIMSLEEAVELGSIVIKAKAMPGIYKTDEYHYQFLGIPEIFAQFKELPNHESDSLGYGREYVGYIGYIAKVEDDSLEVVRAGCLRDHPEFAEIMKYPKKSMGDLAEKLRESAKNWFKTYPWTENEKVALKLDSKRVVCSDETKRLLGLEGHQLKIDDYLDNKWRLSVLSARPWSNAPKKYNTPDIYLGIPESVVHSRSQCKPYGILNYEGSISLENQIMNDIVQPRSLGNGVVIMNEDRIPKYLKRTLGLGA